MNVLFIAYHPASYPIMESQGFAYMRGLSKDGAGYSLLSFETKKSMPDSQKHISELGVPLKWRHLSYHSKPRFLASCLDIARGVLTVALILKRDKIKIIHARGFIAALIAFLPAKLLGVRFFFDTRGLLADKYVCGGLLNKKSATYKLMRLCEDMLINKSDSFTVETERHAKVIMNSRAFGKLNKLNGALSKMNIIPCCIDTNKFNYKLCGQRTENKFSLVFLGKIGTWYLLDEMLDFFIAASKEIKPLFFTFITESEAEDIYSAIRNKKIGESNITVKKAGAGEVPSLLSNATASIFFMNTYKQYSFSPIKFGESLSCGLPVVVNAGIGDCDEIILKERVGVVINDSSLNEYKRAIGELNGLLSEGEALRGRCRRAAERYFSLEMGIQKYWNIYKGLIGDK